MILASSSDLQVTYTQLTVNILIRRADENSPFGLAVDLVLGRSDGIPREGDSGVVTDLEDIKVRGPLACKQ